MKKIEKLSGIYSVVYRSPDPQNYYAFSPGICALPGGRLIVTMDIGGPGMANDAMCGRIFLSDDGGKSWRSVASMPFYHARPFLAGSTLYVLGHSGDLMIARSDDRGETWSAPVKLTSGESWHQAPCNVHYTGENIYLVMEKRLPYACDTWPVSVLAPILMRARCTDDLTQAESWTFASELCARDAVDWEACENFGTPLYDFTPEKATPLAADRRRSFPPPGWLETNVVQFTDPRHLWHDPSGKTFHLWMRAHTGGTNLAAVLKVVEKEDGSMETMPETVPSGKKLIFVPCPGGEMKFHILWDAPSERFWMVCTQPTDSMVRAETLEDDRYDLPNNERQRLVLYYSRNCFDWCFAGLVDQGDTQREARSYASMAIMGDDLYIASRSGDKDAKSAHNTNMITIHKVDDFRSLMY